MSRVFLTIVLSVCSFGLSAVPAFAANESNYTYWPSATLWRLG